MDNPIQQMPSQISDKKVLINIFVILVLIVISSGATYYFQNKQNQKTNSDLQNQINTIQKELETKKSITTTTPTPSPSPTIDPTASWSDYTSTILNLKFKHPKEFGYSEKDLSVANNQSGAKFTGHQDSFIANNNYTTPSFTAISSDFTSYDSVPHDLLLGSSLDNAESIKVATYDKTTQITTEVQPNMFHVTAYNNVECSFAVDSYLFVSPPVGSSLKYIYFHLGTNEANDLTNNNIPDDFNIETCRPSDENTIKLIAAVDKKPSVIQNLNLATEIAKTFSTK